MTPLKSKAHPDWPYAGTAHEWRGFVKAGNSEPIMIEAPRFVSEAEARRPDGIMKMPIYQKQNFGPDLD